MQTYENIIIGGGAAGLFCGANLKNTRHRGRTLLVEKTYKFGNKLMLSGAGQCNFTHGGNIKNFLDKYGENGRNIRKILYNFNNLKTVEFFEANGIDTLQRDDGKVFPKTMKSKDIRDFLVEKIRGNRIEMSVGVNVISIEKVDGKFAVRDDKGREYTSKNLVIATGGASYRKTGSDGGMLEILKRAFPELQVVPIKGSLMPIYVENYKFSGISGIAIRDVKIEQIEKREKDNRTDCKKPTSIGDLLFTHKNLSGPAILNISRYVDRGDKLKIDFLNGCSDIISGGKIRTEGVKKSALNYFVEMTNLPRGFLQIAIAQFIGDEMNGSVEKLGKRKIEKIFENLRNYIVSVTGNGGFDVAMATCGGVALDDINKDTMEHRKVSGMYFAGEVLDVDGDTGGYNIQFAFSSGAAVAKSLLRAHDGGKR